LYELSGINEKIADAIRNRARKNGSVFNYIGNK
jgi:hypothetical protein